MSYLIEQIADNMEEDKPLSKFIEIWNDYARIDPLILPVDVDELVDDGYIDYEDGTVNVPLLDIGDKWAGVSEEEIATYSPIYYVATDIVKYVNKKYGGHLVIGWSVDRGNASLLVGYDDDELYDISDIYDYDDEYDVEPLNVEKQFLGGINESTEDPVEYEGLIDKVLNDPEFAKSLSGSKSPFVKRVLDLVYPNYKREGRYAVNVERGKKPPWYNSRVSSLHRIAEKYGGEFLNIELHDAEAELPLELYHKLTDAAHVMSGRPIGWASAIYIPDKSLNVIEIQSDFMRNANKMLLSKDTILDKEMSRINNKYNIDVAKELFDAYTYRDYKKSLDDITPILAKFYGWKGPIEDMDQSIHSHIRSTAASVYYEFLDVSKKLKLAEYDGYLNKILEGFADWHDMMLNTIYREAKDLGVSVVRFPTASKLGRFWRGVGQNPNMKYLKSLYDRKLRDVASKVDGWWVVYV